jgi:hypothetical protein
MYVYIYTYREHINICVYVVYFNPLHSQYLPFPLITLQIVPTLYLCPIVVITLNVIILGLDSTNDQKHEKFVFLSWLILLNMMFFSSIHFPANLKLFHFYLWVIFYIMYLYICIYMSHFLRSLVFGYHDWFQFGCFVQRSNKHVHAGISLYIDLHSFGLLSA